MNTSSKIWVATIVLAIMAAGISILTNVYIKHKQEAFKEVLVSKEKFLKTCSDTSGHPYVNFFEEQDVMILDCVYYPMTISDKLNTVGKLYSIAIDQIINNSNCDNIKSQIKRFRIDDARMITVCTKYITLNGVQMK